MLFYKRAICEVLGAILFIYLFIYLYLLFRIFVYRPTQSSVLLCSVFVCFRVWPHGDRRLYRLGIKVDYGGMDERYAMNKT